MDNNLDIICVACHFANQPTAYFCSNCGKPLKDKSPSSTITKQAAIYFVSIFLPPCGLWYVWKYLRQPDAKLKNIGIVALILTIISTVFTILYSMAAVNSIIQSMGALNNI